MMYQFFGDQYGWAPYYAYPTTYVVRPQIWYAPKWNAWYQSNPHYWKDFEQRYPYWRGHRPGHHYDQNFYNSTIEARKAGIGSWRLSPAAAPGRDVRPR
jgi:hypothetical protein